MSDSSPEIVNAPKGYLPLISASAYLFRLSFVRLLRSKQTIVCALLLAIVAAVIIAVATRRPWNPNRFVEGIILGVYVTFLLPVFSLSYGTAGIATDRNERTLVYLLVTSLPRPLVFLAKALASLASAAAWTVAGLSLLCWLAGDAGAATWAMLLPVALCSTVTYVTLFLIFSAYFQRATIIALAYAFFIETLLGNMPGIAKRLAVSFYARCMVLEGGAEFGVRVSGPENDRLFVPIPGADAQWILSIAGIVFLAFGLILFSLREYD